MFQLFNFSNEIQIPRGSNGPGDKKIRGGHVPLTCRTYGWGTGSGALALEDFLIFILFLFFLQK